MPDRKSMHTPCLPRDRRGFVVSEANRRVLISLDILGIFETTLDEAGLSTSVGATDGFIDADTIVIDDPLKPKEPRFE